jgi:HAD superfamily hydrolase (TIGR01509 family)
MHGIIFDCDGVLVDSEKLSCGAWLPVFARRGIKVELEEIEAFIGKSDRAVLEHFNRLHGLSMDDTVIDERLEEYFRTARGRLRSFPGIHAAIESLVHRGIALAVASSGTFDKIRFALAEANLTSYFPVVCSSTEVARGKPAPDLFLYAATRLGLRPEQCAVVEDSVFGIAAARAAGMVALGFCSGLPPEALLKAGANHAFAEYPALPALVESLGVNCPPARNTGR